jgi:hypothetical protein
MTWKPLPATPHRGKQQNCEICSVKQELLVCDRQAMLSAHQTPNKRQILHQTSNLMNPRRNSVRGLCVQTAALGRLGSQAVHQLNRRQLLASSAIALLLSSRVAQTALVKGALPWQPGAADPPAAVTPEAWHYFTPSEAATVEAFVDRLIPPDPQTPGGKDCGCAVFIDRSLPVPMAATKPST